MKLHRSGVSIGEASLFSLAQGVQTCRYKSFSQVACVQSELKVCCFMLLSLQAAIAASAAMLLVMQVANAFCLESQLFMHPECDSKPKSDAQGP